MAFRGVLHHSILFLTVCGQILWSPYGFAFHDESTVVNGEAAIVHVDANMVQVTASDQAIIQYSSFNIAPETSVQFIQPSDTATVLNRVMGESGSEIYGALSSNGSLFLVNPQGIFFGPTASVDTGSFVASTLNISDANFMARNYQFEASNAASSSLASIINQGTLTAQDGGYIALIGGPIQNSGVLTANLGSVVLASGNEVTIALTEDGLLQAAVRQPLQGGGGENAILQQGTITADGGRIQLSADAVPGLFKQLINQEGLVRAQSAVSRNGEILLTSGETGLAVNSGTLDASGTENASSGGRITMNGGIIDQRGVANAEARDGGKGGNIEIISQKETRLSGESLVTTRGHGSLSEGGTVIINSLQGNTYFSKNSLVDVSGGEISGNGGAVELSAAHTLTLAGKFVGEAQAPYKSATLFIDPENISFDTPSTEVPDDNESGTADVAFDDVASGGTADVGLEGGTSGLTTIDVADVTGFSELRVQATNDITLNQTLTMNENNSVYWEAGHDITINNPLTVSGAGTVTLRAGNNVYVYNNITAGAGSSTAVTVIADAEVNGVASDGAGTIEFDETEITTTSGDIELESGATFTVSYVDADRDEDGVAGNVTITFNSVEGEGGATKSILALDEFDFEIRANALTLTANGSGTVGSFDEGVSLSTKADSLSVIAIGGIYIDESDNVTLTNLRSTDLDNPDNYGNIEVRSGVGDMTVYTVNAGNGNVTLNLNSDAIIDGNGDDNNITANVATLTAYNIGSSGNPLDTAINTLTATSNSGGTFIKESDGLTVTDTTVIASGEGADVSITVTQGDLQLGVITADGDQVNLEATNGSIIDGNGEQTDITAAGGSLKASGTVGTTDASIDVEFGEGNAFTVRAGTAAGDPPVSAALSGTGSPTGEGTPDGQYQFNGDCFFNCPGGGASADTETDEAADSEASDDVNTAINSSDVDVSEVGGEAPLEMEFGEGSLPEIDMSEVEFEVPAEAPVGEMGGEAPGEPSDEGEISEPTESPGGAASEEGEKPSGEGKDRKKPSK